VTLLLYEDEIRSVADSARVGFAARLDFASVRKREERLANEPLLC
jgi:hypothetical protein